MVVVNDYVVPKGKFSPIGLVEEISDSGVALVRYGVVDRKTYKDHIHVDKLETVPFEVIGEEIDAKVKHPDE